MALEGSLAVLPDDERFLALLVGHLLTIVNSASGEAMTITPQVHVDLLEAAGVDLGRN